MFGYRRSTVPLILLFASVFTLGWLADTVLVETVLDEKQHLKDSGSLSDRNIQSENGSNFEHVIRRQIRSILLPSGMKLCAEETILQAINNHLKYYELRVCQEAVWEAFKIFWDRLPEREEYEMWMNLCESGTLTIFDISVNFSKSEEHQRLIQQTLPLPTEADSSSCNENISSPGSSTMTTLTKSNTTLKVSGNLVVSGLADRFSGDTATNAPSSEVVPIAGIDIAAEKDELTGVNRVEPVTEDSSKEVVEFSILLVGENFREELADPSTLDHQKLVKNIRAEMKNIFGKMPGFQSIHILEFREHQNLDSSSNVLVHYAMTFDGSTRPIETVDTPNEIQGGLSVENQNRAVYTMNDLRSFIAEASHEDRQFGDTWLTFDPETLLLLNAPEIPSHASEDHDRTTLGLSITGSPSAHVNTVPNAERPSMPMTISTNDVIPGNFINGDFQADNKQSIIFSPKDIRISTTASPVDGLLIIEGDADGLLFNNAVQPQSQPVVTEPLSDHTSEEKMISMESSVAVTPRDHSPELSSEREDVSQGIVSISSTDPTVTLDFSEPLPHSVGSIGEGEQTDAGSVIVTSADPSIPSLLVDSDTVYHSDQMPQSTDASGFITEDPDGFDDLSSSTQQIFISSSSVDSDGTTEQSSDDQDIILEYGSGSGIEPDFIWSWTTESSEPISYTPIQVKPQKTDFVQLTSITHDNITIDQHTNPLNIAEIGDVIEDFTESDPDRVMSQEDASLLPEITSNRILDAERVPYISQALTEKVPVQWTPDNLLELTVETLETTGVYDYYSSDSISGVQSILDYSTSADRVTLKQIKESSPKDQAMAEFTMMGHLPTEASTIQNLPLSSSLLDDSIESTIIEQLVTQLPAIEQVIVESLTTDEGMIESPVTDQMTKLSTGEPIIIESPTHEPKVTETVTVRNTATVISIVGQFITETVMGYTVSEASSLDQIIRESPTMGQLATESSDVEQLVPESRAIPQPVTVLESTTTASTTVKVMGELSPVDHDDPIVVEYSEMKPTKIHSSSTQDIGEDDVHSEVQDISTELEHSDLIYHHQEVDSRDKMASGHTELAIAMPTNEAKLSNSTMSKRALIVFFSLRVTNMDFSDDLFNKSSSEYKALEQQFLELLVPYLQLNLTGFKYLEILNFRNGSIVVNSRMQFAKPVPQTVTNAVYLILEDFCNTAYQTMNIAIDRYSLDVESGVQADPCKFQACNEFSECLVNQWSGEAECVCDPGYLSVDSLPCQSICDIDAHFCLNDGKCDIIPGHGAICRCRVGENWWYRGEHCEEYVSEPLVVGIAIASVSGFLLISSAVIFFLAKTVREQFVKGDDEESSRCDDSLGSVENGTKYNPMYESDAATGHSHYCRRYPQPSSYSSTSAEASTDVSSDEIRHIYEHSELSKEEIQDRLRIIDLYTKDRQFAEFVRQHQMAIDNTKRSSTS